jgi:hypothetical protein
MVTINIVKLRVINFCLLVLFLCSGTGCNRETHSEKTRSTLESVASVAREQPEEPLKVLEVISYAQSEWPGPDPQYTKKKEFGNFDFCNFLPANDSISAVGKSSVFYNSNGEIVRIFNSSDVIDSDIDFRVINNLKENYSILFAKRFYESDLMNEQDDPVSGFILKYKDHCYFIGLNTDPLCIMELNNHLKVIKTLRFCSGELIYGTKVNYVNGNHLYSDSLFVPNSKFTIDEKTLFSDMTKQFGIGSNFRFESELKLGLVKEEDNLPLWILGGRHEYGVQLSPVSNNSSRRNLSYNCIILP